MIGARMKTAWTGRVAEDRDRQLGLERVELAPERVALDGHVEQRQDRLLAAGDLVGQDDHPGARPEDRRAALGERRGSARAGPSAR